MIVERASTADVADLARLVWLDTFPDEPDAAEHEAFAGELGGWWTAHPDHHAFVARADGGLIGMAWVALFARVPRPGSLDRLTADVQTVFVLPEHRGRGIGSAVVEAAAAHAEHLGATWVTVHSGRRAVPVYERLGFAASGRLLQRPSDTT